MCIKLSYYKTEAIYILNTPNSGFKLNYFDCLLFMVAAPGTKINNNWI